MPKHIKIVARLVLLCSLLAIGFVFSASQSPAHAQSLTPQMAAAVDNHTCGVHRGSNFLINCFTPTVTALCSGQQFFSATDGLGNPIDWTFTDANNTCVHVNYSISMPFSNCLVLFYVPEGDATATFSFSWTDASGHGHSGSLNENPVTGWTQIISDNSGITDFSFFDHQSDGGLQLGWGSSSGHSLQVTCSA